MIGEILTSSSRSFSRLTAAGTISVCSSIAFCLRSERFSFCFHPSPDRLQHRVATCRHVVTAERELENLEVLHVAVRDEPIRTVRLQPHSDPAAERPSTFAE